MTTDTMTVQEAISHLQAPKGLTTMIASLMSGDFSAIQAQDATGATLAHAREELAKWKAAMNGATSDYAYWGYVGDVAYWNAAVNILEAAELVGADKLPRVPPPNYNGVLMDVASNVENYGRIILAEAAKRLGAR